MQRPIILSIALCSFALACKKPPPNPNDAAAASAASGSGASITSGPLADAAVPVAETPEQKLETYRKHLTDLAEQKKYADVCQGAPWFNKTICTWVANRADGKNVDRPDAGLYRGLFNQEHWVHVYGNVLGDADPDGRYEVTAGGYRNHCLLETSDTKYTTPGAFNLWVQEQPTAEEVTTNSGATRHWVLLEEMPLAKALMDLAHSGVNVESTGRAQDAMAMIAVYKMYSERKGTLPTLPGEATAAPGATSGRETPQSSPPTATAKTPVAHANQPTVAAPTTGTLDVGTVRSPSPSGGWCMLSVDGAPQGKTPLSGIVLSAGPHHIVCTGMGGKTEGATVTIPAGGTARHNFNL